MDRVRFEEHRNVKILFLDFADATVNDVLPAIETAKAIIRQQPHGSLLILTDVSNTKFNDRVVEAIKEFTAHNKPYVKASAVVGVTGLKKIIYNAVVRFSGRKINLCDDIESARDWLVSA